VARSGAGTGVGEGVKVNVGTGVKVGVVVEVNVGEAVGAGASAEHAERIRVDENNASKVWVILFRMDDILPRVVKNSAPSGQN